MSLKSLSEIFIDTLTEMVMDERAQKKGKVLQQFQVYADRFMNRSGTEFDTGGPRPLDFEDADTAKRWS